MRYFMEVTYRGNKIDVVEVEADNYDSAEKAMTLFHMDPLIWA